MQPQLIAGRYQVLRAIGRGGMGTVWLCRDEVLGREVAVKQILAMPGESATETKRALREARSAAALNHPNAVAVYDVVDHDARPWLVMEYVEGQTLADEISRDGQLSPKRVADIGAQLAGALARAHERRIVHRDIKPANVLIDKFGRPKISDFGIARGHGDDQLTQIGFVTGTPGYLSPELARGGDPHPASDVWALGATLYAAVEGQSPYESRGNPIALLQAIATERPRPMTHAGALGPAIEAMMYDDPARRWDMATTAQRLGVIASRDATLVMPRAVPTATRVIAPPLVEPTKRLEAVAPLDVPTQSSEAAELVLEATQRSEAAELVLEATQRSEAAELVLEATQRSEAAELLSEATQRSEAAAPPVKPTKGAAPPIVSTQRSKPAPPPIVSAQRLLDSPPVAAVAAEALARPEPVRPEPAPPRDLIGGAPTPPPNDRGSRRHLLLVAFAGLLVAALGVGFLVSQLGDQGTTSDVAGRPSATAPAKTPATGSAKTSEPAATTAATDAKAGKSLESFVKSYYSEVTKNTDRTWAQLSPTMQGAAGGRNGYDGFWRTIDKVRVNQTQPNASDTQAVVSLTFTRNDGSTSTETHRFTFVTAAGDYLIESDKNLG